jgi:hypothetical protein
MLEDYHVRPERALFLLLTERRSLRYECYNIVVYIEGWLIVKIRHGDNLPVIGRINLNRKMPAPQEATAHG